MLKRPDIQDSVIIACLREHYGINTTRLEFLPLGADVGTAVYRAEAGASDYFVKLRRYPFNEMTVIIPKLLFDQGMTQVIPPLVSESGRLWVALDDFNLSVFPYINGQDGYQRDLTDEHWIEFGRAFKLLHSAAVPLDIRERIQRETYSEQWRAQVKAFMQQIERDTFADPVAAELATFLRSKYDVVDRLVRGAEAYAAQMREKSAPFVLCHADMHAGNVLIDAHERLYIVDWDTLILAPCERDLMYAGGGQFVNTRTPQQEEALFYQGYGDVQPDPIELAYYRYERIVMDIAAYCEQILLTDGESEDRENGLRQLTGQFAPGQVIDITFGSAPG